MTYNHGQKMRAAISHKFGRELGRGIQPWAEDPLAPGMFKGNPSLSMEVSQYMIALRRRKVGTSTPISALNKRVVAGTKWGGGHQCACC